MREIIGIKIALASCLISIGLSLPSAAQSDTRLQSLIKDIKTYIRQCGSVEPNTPPPSKKCANEQAQLVRRQVELHLRNEDVNAKLGEPTKTRGPTYDGGWYPLLR